MSDKAAGPASADGANEQQNQRGQRADECTSERDAVIGAVQRCSEAQQ
jgi:hypothetical protein